MNTTPRLPRCSVPDTPSGASTQITVAELVDAVRRAIAAAKRQRQDAGL